MPQFQPLSADSVAGLQQNVVDSSLRHLGRWQKSRVVRNYLTLFLVVVGPLLALATTLLLGAFNGPENPTLLRAVLLADVVYTLINICGPAGSAYHCGAPVALGWLQVALAAFNGV